MYLVLLYFAVTIATAVTVIPAGQLSAVNEAIAASQPGNVIILSSGTFYGCETDTIVLNRNITLQGMCRRFAKQASIVRSSTGENAAIDCNGSGVAIRTASGCDGAVVDSITIANATTGIVHDTACNVTLFNVTVTHCTNRAINVTAGGMELRLCLIANNTNTVYGGGGVYSSCASTKLDIVSSTFLGNIACSHGGGLYGINGVRVNVFHSVFRENVANNDGGAIYVDTSLTIIFNTTIISNSAVNGGGWYAKGQTRMSSSTVKYNTAISDGGGVLVWVLV